MKSHHKCNHSDHQQWSRRDFLQTLGLAGGVGISLAGLPLSALAAPTLFGPAMGNDRILVLVRFKGGNDGLNTIIPLYDYSTYVNRRPTIHIKQADLINLDNAHAMPKTMQKLQGLWNEGAMKVIQSVGYDNHNLSHFTSADIWNSGNQNIEEVVDKSGWLGRYILQKQPDFLQNLPEAPGAIKINSGSNIAYNNADRVDLAVNFNTIDRLIEIGEKGFFYDTVNLPDNCYYGEQVGYLRSILNVTYKYAPVISNAYQNGNNDVSYSDNLLSSQLAVVAKLIKGNIGTKLFMVTLDGFDTHENQNADHPKLMNNVATAIAEFYADLKVGGKDANVLTMTFSEFGRRVEENTGGTDHGTAAPILMFGPALKDNGIIGDNASLTNLDQNGNLKHDIDFRSVYATILESWLCVNAVDVDALLGGDYERLDNLGIECLETSVFDNLPLVQNLTHHARYNDDGSISIHYTLARPGDVKVEVYSYMGHLLDTLTNDYQISGEHSTLFIKNRYGLSQGVYLYKITSGKSQVSGKLVCR